MRRKSQERDAGLNQHDKRKREHSKRKREHGKRKRESMSRRGTREQEAGCAADTVRPGESKRQMILAREELREWRSSPSERHFRNVC